MSEKIIQTMLRSISPDRIEHEGEIVVIGLGRFGSSVGHTLIEMGYEVLGVDANEQIVQDHSGALTHVVQADTTSPKALKQIGAADAVTVIVCIGTGIEASVLTVTALVDLGVKNIWAKAITGAHGRILQRVGAHHVVYPEADMGKRVAHLVTGDVIEYVALDEDFVMVEMTAPPELSGVPLGESGLRDRYKVTVVCVKQPGQQFTYADRETVLTERDLIVVAGHRDHVERFADHGR